MPPRLRVILHVVWLVAACLGCVTRTEKYEIDVYMPARKVAHAIDAVVVLDFAANVRGWGAGASQSVRSGLAEEGYVPVVQGRASHVLTGSVTVGRATTSTDHDSRRIEYTEDGRKRTKTLHTYSFRKQLTSSLGYELRRGNQTVAADTFSLHFDRTWKSDSARRARDAAPSDNDIIGTQLAMMAKAVVWDLSPHKETRELTLEIGPNKGFSQGMAYLKNGRQDQAMALWKQVADQATEPKEQASALYNIAIILEAQQDYAAAFDLLSQADALVPGTERYIQAMTRVENAKLAQEALALQTGR